MGEITRKHERKPTDGIGILRTGFSRRTLLAGAVGALGLLLTGKALAEEPKKPLTVAKGPAPASVGGDESSTGKRVQYCDYDGRFEEV